MTPHPLLLLLLTHSLTTLTPTHADTPTPTHSPTHSLYHTDFFSRNIPMWQVLFEQVYPEGQQYHFLEVGAWEGRATTWLLQHVLTHEESR